jgi:hypothetical protein
VVSPKPFVSVQNELLICTSSVNTHSVQHD